MGTLTMFIQLSENKEFAKKVRRFYALAPVLKLQNVKGATAVLKNFLTQIDYSIYLSGMEEFLPPTWLAKQFAQYVCGSTEMVGSMVCANALFMIAGPSSLQLNATRLPVYLAHTPAGTSRRTFIHLGQMIDGGKICQYDYGKTKNKEKYGTETPPEFDVTKLETPTALYWGDSDWLATDRDVRNMIPKLKSVFSKNYLGEFNHMDFLWGQRAPWEIYIPIKDDIEKDYDAAHPDHIKSHRS